MPDADDADTDTGVGAVTGADIVDEEANHDEKPVGFDAGELDVMGSDGCDVGAVNAVGGGSSVSGSGKSSTCATGGSTGCSVSGLINCAVDEDSKVLVATVGSCRGALLFCVRKDPNQPRLDEVSEVDSDFSGSKSPARGDAIGSTRSSLDNTFEIF